MKEDEKSTYLKERDHIFSRRWKGIRMDLSEIGWEGVDWMYLGQWRALVDAVKKLRVP
jgi:hypothetical protein